MGKSSPRIGRRASVFGGEIVPSSDPWERILKARTDEQRTGTTFLFPPALMRHLLRSLGRVGDEPKRQLFVVRVEQVLLQARDHWRDVPKAAEIVAIRCVADRAQRLQTAMQALRRHRAATEWMRRAWSPRVSAVSPPEPSIPFDALNEYIGWLKATALELLPEPKRGRQFREDLSGLAILVSVDAFRATFGTSPTTGTNSPFIRFAQLALPQIGCDIPSTDRIRRIVERVRNGEGTIDASLAFSRTRIF